MSASPRLYMYIWEMGFYWWLSSYIQYRFLLFPDDIPLNTSMTSQGVIPGMGPDDKIEEAESTGPETIPGLDFDSSAFDRWAFKKCKQLINYCIISLVCDFAHYVHDTWCKSTTFPIYTSVLMLSHFNQIYYNHACFS